MTDRVVSTASIGRVNLSSSQPYAFGVNLITVCLFRAIQARRQFVAHRSESVQAQDPQRNLDVGQVLLRQIVTIAREQLESDRRIARFVSGRVKCNAQVSVEASQHGLVTDDENVLLPLQLEDDWFQPAHTRYHLVEVQ